MEDYTIIQKSQPSPQWLYFPVVNSAREGSVAILDESGPCKDTVVLGIVEQLGNGGESIVVQEPSPLNMQDLPYIDVHDSSGRNEQCAIDSNATCSTTVSEKTSVFSNSSESDSAPATEISYRYDSPSPKSQFWKDVALPQMDRSVRENAHESCESKLSGIVRVIRGCEELHLSADGQDDSGCHDQNMQTLDEAIVNAEEAILANYEASALRDFMDDPAHRYWTWCQEQQNWWHKDEKMHTKIWAPLDFD